jgi:hypothetical protein
MIKGTIKTDVGLIVELQKENLVDSENGWFLQIAP